MENITTNRFLRLHAYREKLINFIIKGDYEKEKGMKIAKRAMIANRIIVKESLRRVNNYMTYAYFSR